MTGERPIWLYLAGVFLLVLIGAAVLQRGVPLAADPAGGGLVQSVLRGGASGADTIKITMASSSTKREWIDDSVKLFNARSRSSDASLQVGGRAIEVEVLLEEPEPGRKAHYVSGRQIRDTLDGKITPTIVSPADHSWIARLNTEWRSTHGGQGITSGKPRSIARTNVVIAMWESRATALGCWPVATPECTWQRLRALAADPEGWALLGRPEWGPFKFGYGYVGESDSGTQTAIMLCRSGLGKTELTVADVDTENGCGRALVDVERAKIHSGTSSSFLLDQLKTGGPEYLDAVTTNEKEVIAFNQENAGKLREMLVAAYPQDGTVDSDHPFAILDGADWVSADQAEAAGVFERFLLSDQRQQALVATGMRPAEPRSGGLGAPFERVNGVDPAANVVTVPVPDPGVVARITEVWHRVKKPVVVVMVFDKSGSMHGPKIVAAVKGAQEFVRRMDRADQIVWMPFDSTVHAPSYGSGSDGGEDLAQRIGGTSAGGGTALYDAVLRAFDRLEAERRGSPAGRRYGIVVLSDGRDTNSQATLSLVQARLQPHEGDPTGIQIHTIAIGDDADANVLTKIATAAHGRFWKGQTTPDLELVYRNIATYY
jgi:Ca-activated chloride channel family protein